MRICSNPLFITNTLKLATNGIFPDMANPAPTPTMFASAIPHEKKRSGNSLAKYVVMVELGRENKDVVVVDADLSKSTMTTYFAKEFPGRFFSCGIAESNMVGVGAGLAMVGKIPFVASFSVFVMNKGFEQMRIGAAYGRSNLKVVGTHSGISIGEDGPSQMSIEEISLACSLAWFVVLAPADENSTKALVRAAAAYDGPVFIRCGRPKAPVVYG